MEHDIVGGFRLSQQQKHLWTLQQRMAGQPSPFSATCALLIEGEIDTAKLRAALENLTRRHDALRLKFRRLPGMTVPLQVDGGGGVQWSPEQDLNGGGRGGEQDTQLAALIGEAAHRPFDFENGAVTRASLAKLGTARHALVLSLPALSADVRSLENLARELAIAYEAATRGAQPEAETLQYTVISEWLNELLESDEAEVGREHWREHDPANGLHLRLPFETQEETPAAFRPASIARRLDSETTRRLIELAGRAGASVEELMLACWQTLFWRLTSEPEVTIGVAFDGRTDEELLDALGLFERHLPIAAFFDDHATLGDLLKRVSADLRAAAEWQECFSWDQFSASDAGDEQPFLAFCFSFEEAPRRYEAAGVFFSTFKPEAHTDRYKIKLRCRRGDDSLDFDYFYDASLFEVADVERVAGYFEQLLSSIAEHPEAELAHANILSEDERRAVLENFNRVRESFDAPPLIHALFARQAHRTPEAVALSFESESLTYGELDERANRLARFLGERGVGPDVPVAILMERSPEMVTALLGVLKAGGAYLPLDPTLPHERLTLMLKDAGARIVITQERLRGLAPETKEAEVFAIEAEWPEIERYDAAPFDGPALADNLAYVIYTSGSTGKPKGVMIEHRSITNRLLWMQDRFPVSADDTLLQKTVFSFDASVWELFVPLLAGARLVLARPEGHKDSGYIAEVVADERVTVLQLVPSMLGVWLAESKVRECLSLRRMFCGGEALPADLAERFYRTFEHAELVNLYGPTEVSIDATYWVCDREHYAAGHGGAAAEPEGEHGVVPIGLPISNMEVYVLDAHGEPVPFDVAGELYVGGVGLARGYLNRPELTAERFIPHPFSQQKGARLYRTGDLARRLADGRVEFLGRIDQQVKVRGYRIELGEIEAVLRGQPGVRESAVIVREDVPGDQRIVGYVVPQPEALKLQERQLRRLDNGLDVVQLNKNETDLLYEELFEDESYWRNGVELRDGACVFDVGANIGLFTLMVHSTIHDAVVYAFEPIPTTFDVLRANVELYGLNVKPYNCGISDHEGTATFTFYPKVSASSGMYADVGADEQVTRAFMANQDDRLREYADELMEGRFEGVEVSCPLRTLSEVIREAGVERIDLLKVDVEKAELDVLRGIGEEDWPKIKQIVAEVHDIGGNLAKIEALLNRHGFAVEVEEDPSLKGTGLYNLYAFNRAAMREGAAREAVSVEAVTPPPNGHAVTVGELQGYLSERLPEYMVPSAFVLLDALPTLPNGKVDRKALPAPELMHHEPGTFVPPRTPIEEVLAGIWSQLLGAGAIGVHDNFFDLGGHSLMVTQVTSRVRQLFKVPLALRSIFESPTIAQLAERIEEALRQGEDLNIPPIRPVKRDDRRPPLSFGQQRLWFLQQLDAGSAVYNLPRAIRLDGSLDVVVLRRTLGEIIRRHESLRTTFDVEEGRPVQVIHPPAPPEVPITDLSALPEGQREARVRRLAEEEALKPFDLSAGPLMRVSLLRLGEEEHIALLTMHHIVSDGWSSGVFVQEIVTLYDAFYNNRPSPLAELPVQYADYAIWQREWLRGAELERQLAYWKHQLEGELPVLQLPLDRPRPAVQTFNGAIHTTVLPRQLTESLKALSRQEGTTLFMTALAAFQTLLHRYSGQDNIIVGSPIAGRNQTEIEALIGFFVNTLVLRTDISGDPTFRELLGRVRETALGAYAHQDLPFEKLVEELHQGRELSHSPLFQVMFVLHNAPASTLELPGLTVSYLEPEGVTAKFDLTLAMVDTGDDLIGTLEYNTDLFDAATMTRLLLHFHNLLEAIVGQPDRRLSELPLLVEGERTRLLYDWNDAARRDYAEGRCIHQLFERQAALTPDAIAVVARDAELTYAELDARSSRLAARLRDLGVGPEVLVGVLLGRSTHVLSSILAVLKAGGAYVPLDPNYPLQRLRFMLADSGARFMLTEREQAERRREDGLLAEVEQVVIIDDEWEHEAGESIAQASSQVTSRNLAYVIYTSGSTGRPKGIAITHGSTVTLLDWARETFGRDDLSGVLAATSICFDLSIYELFAPLAVGGQVIIAENALEWPASAEERVRLINTVPSVMAELLRSRNGHLPEGVRVVNLAGEALPRSLVEAIYEAGEVERVWNLYGPSEDTTYSTKALIERGGATPPIGSPIANTRVYILDKHLEPVPVGVAGELCLAGAGLARGYLNRPELTAERFIPDPFSREPGARLYRTGDLARYLRDGEIEYLGRIDQQVKVHGFRIELGEIEAVLGAHEHIREVVVVAREDVPGDKRLVAYYIGDGSTALNTAELRAYVRERIPDYMTPSAFIELSEMPLTPSGKVDRRALPAPDAHAPDAAQHVAPRTPAEEIVAGIWTEVLGLSAVGATDDFFELGGHSLLATQVVSRVRESFGVELPLRKFFERPTVEALSAEIEALMQESQGVPTVPPLRPVPRAWGMPLSFAQQRLWFLNQLEPDSPFYNVTTAVRITGALDVAALEQTFNEIVRRHETLRTTFASVGGQPVQVIAPRMVLELPVLSLEQLPEAEREERINRLAVEEALRPFDLRNGPLFRASLLKLGDQEHVILLGMHHIISDGWSLGVLVGEVGALYEAFTRATESPLAELPIQYADFAHWQRSWLQGEGLERQLSYWAEHLRGAPPLLELPTDYARPPIQSYRGAHVSVTIESEVGERLKELSRGSGATLFMTLLAAFKALLSRYSGQTDIVVGSPIANRNRVEIEQLIGFFTNTLVLRTDISGNPTFRELLGRVRETALGAYAHQDLPFEKLVEELEPERELSHSPLFQVMFAVQNAAMPGVALSEINLSPLAVESGSSKFDLSLFMFESDGLRGRVEYNTDLFSHDTIARMIGHFEQLLASIAADPDRRIIDLAMLPAEEQRLLLEEWNDTEVAARKDLSLMQLLRPQLERTPPDRAAVVFESESLSYAELNDRSNRLAHRLRRLGVGPDSLVAVGLERSPDLIIALLAVLKAGGAYVPLDLSYPTERLALMLENARPLALLTHERFAARLPHNDSQVVLLDAEWDAIARESGEEMDGGGATGDNLGYVIYTSGSTGKPKGVAMRQAPLANLIAWQAHVATPAPGARSLQFASIGFDVSFQEIFTALYSGGTVILLSDETRLDPRALLRVINEQEVERVFLPVVGLQQLAETAEELGIVPHSLRDVTTSGDRLQITKPIASWLGKLSGCTMHNQYGPSESHTITEHILEGEPTSWPSLPPVGRPINNARLYVLDARLNPVPVGVAGELYIGGDCLARGYLNRPDLTAERFVPDPFSREPGARLYKSGDLVRYLREGQIEFIGRNDFQVKLRGFRIELGEIEALLGEHPSVREAVAVVREDTPGQKRLVAYVVADAQAESAGAELRSFLKERLPDYMVPSAFVMLDRLPLTQNGKVDRRALPAPDPARRDAEDISIAPRTPIEEVLADIFAVVIGIERAGATDNFFDLGGHSLLATLVMSRIRDAFQVELPLRSIFEEPTVAGLARLVEAELFAGQKMQAPPIVPVPRDVAIPLTFLQERLWRRARTQPPTFYNIETQLTGALDVEAFVRALGEIVRRHEILRTTFEEAEDGQPVQVVHNFDTLDLPFNDLSGLAPEEQRREVARLSARQTERPLELTREPLFRISLLRLGEEEYVLLFTIAHIIADRWSLKVLSRELTTLYEAFATGKDSPLAELPIQYADFAHWQRSWLQGEGLERQLSYWAEHLRGAPPLLELPTDYARPPIQSYRGAHVSVTIESEVGERLKELSRGSGATLFMTLLAAFKALLSRYSGQDSIVVGTATSGRNQVVTEGLIGVFVNPIVMHTDVSGDPTFLELLGRVRETALGAYAHQETPFEKLLEVLRPVQDQSYAPIAQVGFVLHAQKEAAARTGLRMAPMPTFSGRSAYDMTMRMIETPEKLTGTLEYNTDLFESETVKRVLEDYVLLLGQIVADPETRLASLELSRAPGRRRAAEKGS
jgi:amino acid adenylation domain-containing protein/FkbM family methyltransferase